MIEFILSLIFPPKCPYCSKAIGRNMTECNACRSQFPHYPTITYLKSGEICASPFVYESTVREAVISYKFYGRKFNAESFSLQLIKTVELAFEGIDFDIVMCVPLSKKRMRERGFNQSEIIARRLAEYFKKPFDDSLIKLKDNHEQHKLSAREREINVKGVYGISDNSRIKGKSILIADDIITTGNTIAECSRVLKENGAREVYCVSIACASMDHGAFSK